MVHTGVADISPGGSSEAAPPVPIPNTVVKRFSAYDTALATEWENRSPPGGISSANSPKLHLPSLRLQCIQRMGPFICADKNPPCAEIRPSWASVSIVLSALLYLYTQGMPLI